MSDSGSISNARLRSKVQDNTTYVKAVAEDAVESYGWMYPIKGVFYFLDHKDLWKPFGKIILPSMLISLAVLVFMFAFTYFPQAAVMSIVQFGPLGFVSAVPLVVSESTFIINIILRTFIISERVTEVFDQVLINEGQAQLVSKGREIQQANGVQKIGKTLSAPLARLSPRALLYYIITLPLQFIPVAGTAIFFVLNGAKTGPSMSERYFQLKGYTPDQKKMFIHDHRGAYAGMGVVCLLLNTIPFAGVLFSFTNAVGAALFSAKVERGQSPSSIKDE